MEFTKFYTEFQHNFEKLVKGADRLFVSNVDKEALWNLYLDSFPPGTNEIYRTRREYDCSCCRHFFRDMANVVVIKDGEVKTLWDFKTKSATFKPVIAALDKAVRQGEITEVFVTNMDRIGTAYSHEHMEDGRIHKWEHFFLDIPSRLITRGRIGEEQNLLRTGKQVFKRSLDEITIEAVNTVLELIAQNSLYRGTEWVGVLKEFKKHQKEYEKLPADKKDLYAWEKSASAGPAMTRIRNHSIGTLLVDISEGMELDQAVRRYDAIVAPANYKRPKAIFTKKMLEDAEKKIVSLGYMDSLARRFATLDDITVNNILFSNKDVAKRIQGGNIFDQMKEEVSSNPKKFSSVQEIGIADFISSVLPTASSVEVLLEGKHAANMVSLTAPAVSGSKTMFKWDNAFGWAYSGNIADSDVKENVKKAGGRVDGALRFSIQWNDTELDQNDLDAHCLFNGREHIYYASKHGKLTKGALDVDIISPRPNKPAVENIVWPTIQSVTPGTYDFYVKCFSNRGGRSGFRAEIEFDGNTHSYDYGRELRHGEEVRVATVTYGANGFSIAERLDSSVSGRDIWGLTTNTFVPVSVIMFSPNYWDEQSGIGHKHYFFMLKDCVNPEEPNGYYNEFLKEELLEHKRVFEALGSRMKVQTVPDQLSGLGFASTKRGELVVKVRGQTERVLRIKF